MRIYHPKHGILHVSDQAEIKRLLDTGGEQFDVHDKPWQRVTNAEEVRAELIINKPKLGRPAKHGNH